MKWDLLYKKNEVGDKGSSKDNILAQLFVNRGITDITIQQTFLNPSHKDIHNADKLYGATDAATHILKAVADNKKIIIYGDYDVDGITATSILFDFLYRHLGADVIPFVPNRFDDGYGLNADVLDSFIKKGIDLIITVDCGVRDIELVKTYSKKGLDIIITDHHSPSKDEKNEVILPDSAIAIVHPALGDYPFASIAGATVSWKLVTVLADMARAQSKLKDDVNADKYLDMVALATVCDIMPLIDENRAIVYFGLKQFANTRNIGLRAIANFLNIDLEEIASYHLGFVIGPRLNASGRIRHAIDAVRLLTTNNMENADKIVLELDRLNTYRRKITVELVTEIEKELLNYTEMPKLIFAYGEEWPEGIVGLVAGKLTEKYSRPVLIGSIKEGIVKGSARSIKDFNITDAITKFDDLLDRYGGHKLAAGFTLKEDNIEDFKTGLQELAMRDLTDDDLIPTVQVEAELSNDLLNMDFVDVLSALKPFGYGNKRPIFLLSGCDVLQSRAIGKEKSHLKLQIQSGDNTIDVIGFNQASRLSEVFTGARINMVGYLEINEWNGNKNIQFNLKDFKIDEKNS